MLTFFIQMSSALLIITPMFCGSRQSPTGLGASILKLSNPHLVIFFGSSTLVTVALDFFKNFVSIQSVNGTTNVISFPFTALIFRMYEISVSSFIQVSCFPPSIKLSISINRSHSFVASRVISIVSPAFRPEADCTRINVVPDGT